VGGGVLGHVEVEDAPPMVGEHDEDEEHRGHAGDQGLDLGADGRATPYCPDIRPKCAPAVRGRAR
jgi:hypothetical protein